VQHIYSRATSELTQTVSTDGETLALENDRRRTRMCIGRVPERVRVWRGDCDCGFSGCIRRNDVTIDILVDGCEYLCRRCYSTYTLPRVFIERLRFVEVHTHTGLNRPFETEKMVGLKVEGNSRTRSRRTDDRQTYSRGPRRVCWFGQYWIYSNHSGC
jgi:hypothetical protein